MPVCSATALDEALHQHNVVARMDLEELFVDQ